MKKSFMIFKLQYIVFFFLITSFFLQGQSNTKQDSLVQRYESLNDGIPKIKVLEELFYNNVYNDPKMGEYYARLGRKLTEKLDNKEGYGVSVYHLGVSKQLQTELDSALYYYEIASKFFKKYDDKPHYASVIGAISDIEKRKGNFEKAIQYNQEANEIHKSVNDQLRYGIGVGNLGGIYSDMGNKKMAIKKSIEALKILDTVSQEPWRKADILREIGRIELNRKNFDASLEYLKKALKVYEETNDNIWTAYTLTDIGNAYLDKKDFEKAEKTYGKSLAIANEFKLLDTRANLVNNLGIIDFEKGNYEEARRKIREALEYNRENELSYSILENLIALSRLELKTKNYSTLNALTNEGLRLSDSTEQFDIKKEFHFLKSQLYEQQGQYKQALNQKNIFIKLNDSITKVNNAKQIDELKISFETEQKEKEIDLKNKEIELLEERRQKSENQRLFIIITALGILALAVAVIYGLRQRMKGNKVQREKLDIDLEFKEKQLTTHALHLAHKNEVLLSLKNQLKNIKSQNSNSKSFQNIINNINLDIINDGNWEQFKTYFEDVHKDFNSKVMKDYPNLSKNDLRLMSLLKMNLNSKEIANILNISIEGVKKARYRLRKKLNLSTEDSLQELVISM